jgi:Cu+-exporting ATPase
MILTETVNCFHCGENCNPSIHIEEKNFCCEGCKQVYLLLNENNLCSYYDFEKNPGLTAKGKFSGNRFSFLDEMDTVKKIVAFSSDTLMNVTFYLPQIHCASCVFLLENLRQINAGVLKSQTNFQRKEIFISFNPQLVSLRQVVELLAFVGYEPLINLQSEKGSENKLVVNRKAIYKIGIAGFAFANIMMLSFPEYFSGGNIEQLFLKHTFSYLIFALSLPVLFWSANEFFVSAFKGLRQGILNIDAPIALATLITFSRSYYEILSGTGVGYLDSGTGIVLFMLVGRWFQNRTYDSFSFDRDYKSYFPLGVTKIWNGIEKQISVTQLKKGDRIIIRNNELIPADAILINGLAHIDYSFISGEKQLVNKQIGDLVYAGGKQSGTAIELEIVNEVSQSYITLLWNNSVFRKESKSNKESFIHPWSRYFTLALFSIAIGSALFWWWYNPSEIWRVVTAVLIVACPCTLLLSATFTFGNMLRHFGQQKLFLKNNGVIETLARVNTIVFDKTGTLTAQQLNTIKFVGKELTAPQQQVIRSVCSHSSHPLSKMIVSFLTKQKNLVIEDFNEINGNGILARVNGISVKIGSANFIFNAEVQQQSTSVHVEIDHLYLGHFLFSNDYRKDIDHSIAKLLSQHYELHVLSGDNDGEKDNLRQLFGEQVVLKFNQSPHDKLRYIAYLQQDKNKVVLMLGDGLNDAGALMQSNVGIAVTDNTALFTPACDAILDGAQLTKLPSFLRYAKSEKSIVAISFVTSILYNCIGESFAVSGHLKPVVAAILMPVSSITLVLFVTLMSAFSAKRNGL